MRGLEGQESASDVITGHESVFKYTVIRLDPTPFWIRTAAHHRAHPDPRDLQTSCESPSVKNVAS